MVQEKVQLPREANGYHGVVPTAEVVVSRQDKVDKLKKASAHQLFIIKKRRQNTLLTGTVTISVGQGLGGLPGLLRWI